MPTISITARELGATIAEDNVSLLIGSGVSCACGLPSWEALIRDMKKELRKYCPSADRAALSQFLRSNDATQIAGVFKSHRGPVNYYKFLRSRFRHQAYVCAPLLKVISRLPVKVLFTTNFDKLLETACREGGAAEDPVVVIDPNQVQPLNGRERQIIKLHGDIDHPDSIVLTNEDYTAFEDRCEAIALMLRAHIAFSTVVLVGFGLKDPNFSRIYASARRLVAGSGTRVIALMAGQNVYEMRRWQQDGLIINHFDTYDGVPAFLRTVSRYC